MWPGNFRARFDPLEIIDNHNQTVAHGGRWVRLAGGYLKTDDPRSLGHQRVFFAWQASEADDDPPDEMPRQEATKWGPEATKNTPRDTGTPRRHTARFGIAANPEAA
jgi:hypothetical protein